MTRKSYATTSRRLQRSAPAMRLFEKAKRLGIWNPSDIDMVQDGMDWQQLDWAEKQSCYTSRRSSRPVKKQ